MLKRKTFIEASKYSVVGGLCTILDITVLFVLGHYFAVDYLLASVISFLTGATLNYFLCTVWIFDFRVVNKRHQEFTCYLMITAFVLAVNTVLMWTFTDKFGLHFMVSKLIAVFFTFTLNFSMRKYLLHTARPL